MFLICNDEKKLLLFDKLRDYFVKTNHSIVMDADERIRRQGLLEMVQALGAGDGRHINRVERAEVVLAQDVRDLGCLHLPEAFGCLHDDPIVVCFHMFFLVTLLLGLMELQLKHHRAHNRPVDAHRIAQILRRIVLVKMVQQAIT